MTSTTVPSSIDEVTPQWLTDALGTPVAEVYAADDGAERLVRDFVRAWTKVMMNDRFDVATR